MYLKVRFICRLGFIIESVQAFFFYIMQYSISNLNAFILIITIGYTLHSYVTDKDTLDLTNIESKLNACDNAVDSFENDRLEEFPLVYIQALDYVNKTPNDYDDNRMFTIDNDLKVEAQNNEDAISLKFEKANEDTLDLSNIESILNACHNAQNNEYAISLKWKKANEYTKDIENLKDLDDSPIQLIEQLKGYYYINPFLALSLSITLFSFAGVPPLIGFFAKQMVLSAALDNGYIFMVLIAILTSVISAVYYLAVIKQIFFDKPNYKLNPVLDNINLNAIITDENLIIKKINFKTNNIVISSCLTLIISVLTLIILLFILIPQEWLSMVNILSILLFNI